MISQNDYLEVTECERWPALRELFLLPPCSGKRTLIGIEDITAIVSAGDKYTRIILCSGKELKVRQNYETVAREIAAPALSFMDVARKCYPN